jgi:hypothetical protein
MEAAKDCANNMMQAMSDFSEAILGQAKKFPALAEKIETRDITDANRWEA